MAFHKKSVARIEIVHNAINQNADAFYREFLGKPNERLSRQGRYMPRSLARELDAMTLPTITRAIRRRCLDCVGGSSKQVAECAETKCTLWPHRFGVNPANARTTDKRGLHCPADLSREGWLVEELAPELTKHDFRHLTPIIDISSVLAPGKAIKAHCGWCQGGSKAAVRDYPSGNCALNRFQFGRHPNRKNYTPEQREALHQRIKALRAKHLGGDMTSKSTIAPDAWSARAKRTGVGGNYPQAKNEMVDYGQSPTTPEKLTLKWK